MVDWDSRNGKCNASLTKADKAEGRVIRDNIGGGGADNEVNALAYSAEGRKVESGPKEMHVVHGRAKKTWALANYTQSKQ